MSESVDEQPRNRTHATVVGLVKGFQREVPRRVQLVLLAFGIVQCKVCSYVGEGGTSSYVVSGGDDPVPQAAVVDKVLSLAIGGDELGAAAGKLPQSQNNPLGLLTD